MFVYPELDSDDNLQRRPSPDSIFMGSFGVSQVSRDRPDKKKFHSIDSTISWSQIKPSDWSTHITFLFLWIMSRKYVSESSSIPCVIGLDLITTTKSSPEGEEYDNFDREWLFHVLIVPVFQAWRKMINFWWIAVDLWTLVEIVELNGTRPKDYPVLIKIWSN